MVFSCIGLEFFLVFCDSFVCFCSLVTLCRLCIFGVRAVFGVGACYVFPQGVLAIVLLMGSMFGVGETRAYTGCWVEQPLWSMGVTALMGSGSAPSSLGVKNPRSGFKLQCEEWSAPTGKETLVYSSPWVVHRGHAIQ